ncbi:response regulator [Natranaeroarchaeum aerophilus]|uniref:Response regulator n=1 Tax=Natranaeroarchaeum aerophilus TaxID=2917711 RepID=A0AAE3FSP5_9EURY|nr:response regulator [Natranaeroarchaeum aerophilus]MCL9813844.1 response regulator [Natranaeroarchaeum aerophilus]
MEPAPGASILVVDDEERIADLYASHLEERYRVETAYSGLDALELIDDEFDVVLLDRRMPELTGDEVLDRIRGEGYEGKVVMVTATDPDFDILDMPFDEYVIKPVTGETIRNVVETQLLLDSYEMRLNEYFRIKSKLSALERTKSQFELDDNDRYEELTVLSTSIRDDLESLLDEHDELAFAEDEFLDE